MKHATSIRAGFIVVAAQALLACGPGEGDTANALQDTPENNLENTLSTSQSTSEDALVGGAVASSDTFPAVGKLERIAYIPTGTAVPTANVKVGKKVYPLLCMPGYGTAYTMTGVDGAKVSFCPGTGPLVNVPVGSQTLKLPSGSGTPVEIPFAGCTATIISRWGDLVASGNNILVLTAGHCVVTDDHVSASRGTLPARDELRFTLPANSKHKDRLTFKATSIRVAFNLEGSFLNPSQTDMAVVEMQQVSGGTYRPKTDPLYFDRGAGNTQNLAAGTTVSVVGFGVTGAKANNYGTMRTGNMLVTGYAGNFVNLKTASTTTTCGGDSGGPNYVSLVAPGSAPKSAAVRYILAVTSQGAANCTAAKNTTTAFQSLTNPVSYNFLQN